ncbi:hypothetical protein MET9862_01758 [Methylobacterium symbioticum]|uniref:Uncharacterized protein n=1 Tax=Methylobacterium symbioticum TaxID=2584084 RepID=A0A509EAF8_9HYPH|nr:hypothetical protein MET9862_01758 [Methylobacterium symbioticum]
MAVAGNLDSPFSLSYDRMVAATQITQSLISEDAPLVGNLNGKRRLAKHRSLQLPEQRVMTRAVA